MKPLSICPSKIIFVEEIGGKRVNGVVFPPNMKPLRICPFKIIFVEGIGGKRKNGGLSSSHQTIEHLFIKWDFAHCVAIVSFDFFPTYKYDTPV